MKKLCFPLCGVLLAVFLWFGTAESAFGGRNTEEAGEKSALEAVFDVVGSIFGQEPKEVRDLRALEVSETEEGHREYYFKQLSGEEKRVYREMLRGIRGREAEFYLTSSEDDLVDRVYHAVLKDHPELFWIHNRKAVYKTTYPGEDYSRFAPGYTYTDEEILEIQAFMEQGYQQVLDQIPPSADDYETVKIVYSYLIDNVEYVSGEHDQSIAGVFWKKEAVCAGYARATQYLLERLGVPCIYVEGDAADSTEGHAWNIVELDGEYFYVDATNGDQPEFLEGDAVKFVEHKTILYDYLCPFPEEYETAYTASQEFEIPRCSSRAKNFYVLNQGCFDTYNVDALYDYCRMRLDNGAAVVRFKFSSREAYNQAYREWIQEGYIDHVAEYYLQLYGQTSVEYHYGVLENMNTMYFMF